MTASLTLTHPAGQTIYAILRTPADARAFNLQTQALEAWAPENRADYAVALEDIGGDLYQALFPTAAPTGLWRVHFYRQLSSQPSGSDPVVSFAIASWSGTALSDVDQSDLSAGALIGLTSLKRQLRIEDDQEDALLIDCINAASAWLSQVTGRQFSLAQHVVTIGVSADQASLVLPHYPAVGPVEVRFHGSAALTVRPSAAWLEATVSADTSGLTLGWIDGSGGAHNQTLTFEDHPTLGALSAAIGNVAGWSASALIPGASERLGPLERVDVTGGATLSLWDHVDRAARADGPTGHVVLGRRSGRPRTARVSYSAGFQEIPHDVQQLCGRLAARLYHAGRHDPTVARESLGEYAVTRDVGQELAAEDRISLSRLTDLRPA